MTDIDDEYVWYWHPLGYPVTGPDGCEDCALGPGMPHQGPFPLGHPPIPKRKDGR
jgi:hypothetical protein